MTRTDIPLSAADYERTTDRIGDYVFDQIASAVDPESDDLRAQLRDMAFEAAHAAWSEGLTINQWQDDAVHIARRRAA